MAAGNRLNSVVVRTPSRLHFGLLGWGPSAPRQFGGLGLMVEDPGLEVALSRSTTWSARGPLADRSLQAARSIVEILSNDHDHVIDCYEIEVRQAPREHVGLGVGTQLTLAIARGLIELGGGPAPDADRLTRLTGRGRRSGVGLHGFLQGGLVLDGGRGPRSGYPPLLARYEFPEDWRILIVIPEVETSIHGLVERRAFERIAEVPAAITERLAGLVLLGALPALVERDLPAFGRSIAAIQKRVGECFAPVQGGGFAHPEVDRLVQAMTEMGLHGVGQSSWGPTVYGFSDGDEAERLAIRERIEAQFRERPMTMFWTRTSRSGATVRSE